MECVKARARATTGGGRCKCGRKARPRDVRTSGRCWVACDRCLGTIRRLPDASMVREDGSEYGAPDDLRNEDDPALWNPRYVLFARFNGRTPADQRRRDREKNGAAVNLGFMVWISGMLVRCGREHPSAMLNGYAYDHATWDAFLLRETEQREALRTKVAEGPNDHAIPLVDLRPGDCVRILGQILPVDSDFAARWKLRGETTIPAYAVILAGAHIAGPDPEDEDARSAVPPAPGDGASTVREDGPEYGVRRPWRIGDRVQYWQPGFPSGTVVGGSREDDRVLVRWDDEPDDMWVDPRDVTDGEPVRNDPPANDPPAGFWGKLSAKEDALRRAVRSLRDARDALRSVHADRAAAAVCRAMKSAEGALRHAQGIASRAARKQGGPS